MAQKSNNALLGLIALILIGILGVLVYTNFIEKTPEEKMADSVEKTMESIGNAIGGDRR